MNKPTTWIALALAAATLGCSKFSGKRQPDLSSFLYYAEGFIGDADRNLQGPGGESLWVYVDAEEPALQSMLAGFEQLEELSDELGHDSAGVARISSPKFPPAARSRELSARFAELVAALREDHGLQLMDDPAVLDDTIAVASSEKDLLGSLGTLQPAVFVVAEAIDERIEQVMQEEREWFIEIDGRIEGAHGAVLDYDAVLRNRRDLILRALVVADALRRGGADRSTLEELELVIGFDEQGLRELDPAELEAKLRAMLAENAAERRGLEVDLAGYVAQRHELWQVLDADEERLRRMRRSVFGWSIAHQMMAVGYKAPAEWFQLTDPYAAVRGPAPSR